MELERKLSVQQQKTEKKPNLTGIPLQMKQSFEQSSGLSFDDVRVHYHSALPARLGALAYTLGSYVYVASGQERHLGHELGHVIQQKQGRVRTTSVLNGVRLNTSPAMEREADALSRQAERGQAIQRRQGPSSEVVQMVRYLDIDAMWADICGDADVTAMIPQIIQRDPVLAELYSDAARQVPNCDFCGGKKNIQIGINAGGSTPYFIEYGAFPDAPQDQYFFIAAIIHELTHADVLENYNRNIPDTEFGGRARWLNMNLPPANGADEITSKQKDSFIMQSNRLSKNIQYLRSVVEQDNDLHKRSSLVYEHLAGENGRLNYMEVCSPDVHYDTVLGDMMFYLQYNKLQDTRSYQLMQRMLREANDRRHHRRWFGNNEMPHDFTGCRRWPGQ